MSKQRIIKEIKMSNENPEKKKMFFFVINAKNGVTKMCMKAKSEK